MPCGTAAGYVSLGSTARWQTPPSSSPDPSARRAGHVDRLHQECGRPRLATCLLHHSPAQSARTKRQVLREHRASGGNWKVNGLNLQVGEYV